MCRRLRVDPATVILVAALLAFVPFASAAASAAGPLGARTVSAPPDAAFIAARDAFLAADRARFDAAAAKARGHELESYVAWWGLRMRLESVDPAAVRAFLQQHAGSALADRSRIEWLKELARRQDWTRFGEELPAAAGNDAGEFACVAILYRRAQGADEAMRAALPLWLSGRESPEVCNPLFDAMFAAGELSVADVWARFRLASEAGRYKLVARLNDRLPEAARIPAKALEQAGNAPVTSLGRSDLRPQLRAHRELLLYALQRASRDSPAAAREPWVRIRDRLPREDRLYGNAQLAYNASRRHLPEAVAWFREAEGFAASDELLAWRARAALRARAWREVVAAIEAMSESGRQEAAWRYWHARARRELGHKGESEVLAELAREVHFYGLLAAEDLGRSLDLRSEPLAPDEERLAAFGARPDVRRMLRLYAVDMRQEALQEWIHALRGATDEELLVASEFARRQQIWDRAINAAERTRFRHDFGLRFLAPYRDVLGGAARQNNVEEALVLGLVRQESRFRQDIVSSAGAVGLMQLMPATAQWVARQLKRADYRAEHIGRVELNAEFGTWYLRHVLDRLEGLPLLAAAAYNAGPGRARAWQGSAALEGAIYAESIPFNETRDYVKKVLANAVLYSHQLGLPRLTLKQRLGVIPPRGGDVSAAAVEAN